VGRRLRFTNKEIGSARWLLQNLAVTQHAASQPWPLLQPVLVHEDAPDLVAFHEAITGPDDPNLQVCRQQLSLAPEQLNPQPLIDGGDLIAAGLEPGPQFAVLLEQIRSAQLDGRIHTRDEALEMLARRRAHGVDSEP
jgi:hypothetical protein